MAKRVNKSAAQAREGVSAVQYIVATDLGWLFREQPTDDYGIDAQIEVVDEGVATGGLVAAQIKAGPSHVGGSHPEGWWFPLRKSDLEYWLDHALPVVVVWYDTDSRTAYWEPVTDESVITGPLGGKRVVLKRSNELGSTSAAALRKVASGNPYELRIRQLRLALPWMKLLQSGRRILLEVDEWVNKSSGRGDVEIVSVDGGNEDRESLGSWCILAGSQRYQEVLPALVPWADVVLHEETYDEADHEEWEAECTRYDREGDRVISTSFEDWHRQFDGVGLRPFSSSADEVDSWRLELVLNDLGRGFLRVDSFAERDSSVVLVPEKPDNTAPNSE